MLSIDVLVVMMMICLRPSLSDGPFLRQSYPAESTVVTSRFNGGPCSVALKSHSFLKGTERSSLNHTECVHNADESMLTCKLGLAHISSELKLDSYPVDEIKVLMIFAQTWPEKNNRSRVLDLCFVSQLRSSLEEIAICGYIPPLTGNITEEYLPILDVPTLAAMAPKIKTLLISSVDVWQIVELRQIKSLKNLLIVQGDTLSMTYYHSPHCADCIDFHPQARFAFHYLIALASKLDYFLYDSGDPSKDCEFDLLKKLQPKIGTLVVASRTYSADKDKPICDTCASGLCPLLAVCLDKKTPDRRKKDDPFECLCVEEVRQADEFFSCKPMTLHQPIYSERCGHTPSFWNYVTLPMYLVTGYMGLSLIIFLVSTVFLLNCT